MIPVAIGPADLKARLDQEQVSLIDCREPAEHQIAAIAGSTLIPMNTIPMQLETIAALAAAKPVVVYCHHGIRSLNVVNWLRQQGVSNCQSLEGGIDAWSMVVDPAVPRY